MNIFRRIFGSKRREARELEALKARLAAGPLKDLLGTTQKPAAKAAPEYYALSLTEEDRRALMRVMVRGICCDLPGFETAEVTQEDRDRTFDILFRLKATTGSQQGIDEAGKLITVTTVRL